MGAVVAFGGEQEAAEFTAIHRVLLAGFDLRPANVLGRVGGDAAVDVSEPVVAAHCRQSPVDRRRRQSALLRRGAVDLDVGSGRGEHVEVLVGGPLEEVAQIVPVGVERSVAVARQERSRRQLRLVRPTVRLVVGGDDGLGCQQCCHRVPQRFMGGPHNMGASATPSYRATEPAVRDAIGPVGPNDESVGRCSGRGVARKRRELNRPESGVLDPVTSNDWLCR